MKIIDLKNANIENMINLYILYCKEIRIPVNQEIAKQYLNKVLLKINEGLPLYFKIVKIEEQEIGFIFFNTNFKYKKEDDAFILELFVKEEYRYQGIGKMILQYAEELSKEAGSSTIYLTTDENIELFYKKCGYLPTGNIDMDNELEIYYKDI